LYAAFAGEASIRIIVDCRVHTPSKRKMRVGRNQYITTQPKLPKPLGLFSQLVDSVGFRGVGVVVGVLRAVPFATGRRHRLQTCASACYRTCTPGRALCVFAYVFILSSKSLILELFLLTRLRFWI